MPVVGIGAEEDRRRDAERRDLRQREIDEDDPPADDVESEVDQQSGQQDQRDERPEPEGQKSHGDLLRLPARAPARCVSRWCR